MEIDRKGGKGKKPGETTTGIARKAIESNTQIAALAMKDAPAFQKTIVYGCYGIILIAAIVLGVPPYESVKQLLVFGLGAVSLLIVVVMVIRRYRELSGSDTPGGPEAAKPHPGAIQLSEVVYQGVRTVLEDARKKAYEFLSQTKKGLADDQVRANVFLPEYGPSRNSNDYMLRIYPGLHLKMNHPPELGITFEPGQGATGQVFESGRPRVTQRLASGSGDWDAIYDITDELSAIIHPDLKWIISMPLRGAEGRPIGVMNIDGLRDQLHVDVLYECMAKVTDSVIILSSVVTGR